MRAISLVHKVEFEFTGNVARGAMTLGDVDNDGHNELVIGNDKGEVAIFKGSERLQTLSDLNFVSCLAVGDIRNVGKNSLVIISPDGWCYIYEALHDSLSSSFEDLTVCDAEAKEVTDEVDGQGPSSSNPATTSETHSSGDGEPTLREQKSPVKNNLKNPLVCVHKQQIPANVKAMILDDVDSDGHIEMVVGLTDRVIRSFRFSSEDAASLSEGPSLTDDPQCGQLVDINKWECDKQIGSITLHHASDGKPAIMVAQPGGTFMRIRCHSDGVAKIDGDGIEVGTEVLPESVDYQFLGISRMRNPDISTEILGDINSPANESPSSGQSRPYAVATLDGTIMLVQDEVILWAIAVDHQVFALTKLDITGDGCDEIVACCWDGQTYILDQKKNSVRFHLEEPVRAFHSGWYTLDAAKGPVTAMIYVTCKNTVVVYYDIPLTDLVCKRFEPDLEELSRLFISETVTKEEALEIVKSMDRKAIKDLVEYVMYDVNINESGES